MSIPFVFFGLKWDGHNPNTSRLFPLMDAWQSTADGTNAINFVLGRGERRKNAVYLSRQSWEWQSCGPWQSQRNDKHAVCYYDNNLNMRPWRNKECKAHSSHWSDSKDVVSQPNVIPNYSIWQRNYNKIAICIMNSLSVNMLMIRW